ncbi:MAG: M43 family zinc metalloprotease [Flavisolibacter sp.]
MKNLYFLVLAALLPLIFFTESSAQKPGGHQRNITRCYTMERAASHLENNLLTRMEDHQKTRISTRVSGYRLNAVVMIPVVVHIVLPNPYGITDADVQAQLDRLNQDFAGTNPDSTNVPPAFLALRGHSQIQFCLAKRTPAGQQTSGIERRVSGVGSLPKDNDPIKFTSMGGLDQWDPNAYLNLWVGKDDSGNDILGYSLFPGTSPVAEDGIFINFESWGLSSCYTLPDYNRGRTATHEIGHYFGLLHIWGDDDGCQGDDFRDLTDSSIGSTCSLPPGLYNPPGQGNTPADIGDTPNQAGESTNCPTGIATDACATTAPGKMYENFMDYSPDACLTLFTKKQVERMEWVLDNCRASLKTSLGCQPPLSAVTRDAAVLQSVNPGGFELSGCSTKTYSSVVLCSGAFTPKIRITNNSSTLLNTVTVGYIIDNGPAFTQTFTVHLGLGETTVISFPSVNVAEGPHTIHFFTSNPNGGPDQVPSNDTLASSFTVNGTSGVPFIESFTDTLFPPPRWSVINPDGGITWQRYPVGRDNPGSAYVNTFNYAANGETDDLVTPRIGFSTTGIDSVKLTFDLASATYTNIDDPVNAGTTLDTLSILVTPDCGNTFTTVYKKWGKELRTVLSPQTDEFFPAAGDWRKDTVDLTAFAEQNPIQLFFRLTNNYENNVFLDNISVKTSAVPKLLKSQGYLILPNPFRQSFAVWHYRTPTTLRSIKVFNTAGQLVWTRDYNGNANTYMTIDLFGRAAGLYVVRLEYTDKSKNISQQVIKY